MTTMVEKIIQKYGDSTLRKSAMNIRRGGGVFEAVLDGHRDWTVLEIGTYKGVSSAVLARLCKYVHTIDLRYGKIEKNLDVWYRREFWKSLDVNNISFYQVDDNEEKASIIRTLNFDLAFIDGGHTRDEVRLDFELTKHCGRVLFHDADDNGPGKKNDVHEFIMTLDQTKVVFMDKIFALWTL